MCNRPVGRPNLPFTSGRLPLSGKLRDRRSVTPEVAGSSPVAPVKVLQMSIFCRRLWRKRPPASFIPRSSRAGNSRLDPPRAANPRTSDDRPGRRSSSGSGMKMPLICRAFIRQRAASRSHPAPALVRRSRFDCYATSTPRGLVNRVQPPPRSSAHRSRAELILSPGHPVYHPPPLLRNPFSPDARRPGLRWQSAPRRRSDRRQA